MPFPIEMASIKSLSQTDVYVLWRSLRTVEEMLIDRGYQRHEEDWESYAKAGETVSEEEFGGVHTDTLDDAEATRKNMRFRFIKNNKVAVLALWKNSLGTNDIQEIHETMKENEVSHAITIYATKITPYAATALRNLRVQKIIIETFSEAEMQYNVAKHDDVPRHIICSVSKKAKVLQEYSVTQEQVPQIKVTDAVCRYYGAVKGQLIKIVRSSDCEPVVITTVEGPKQLYDISYRIVV